MVRTIWIWSWWDEVRFPAWLESGLGGNPTNDHWMGLQWLMFGTRTFDFWSIHWMGLQWKLTDLRGTPKSIVPEKKARPCPAGALTWWWWWWWWFWRWRRGMRIVDTDDDYADKLWWLWWQIMMILTSKSTLSSLCLSPHGPYFFPGKSWSSLRWTRSV